MYSEIPVFKGFLGVNELSNKLRRILNGEVEH
jgi:hypothetical protein